MTDSFNSRSNRTNAMQRSAEWMANFATALSKAQGMSDRIEEARLITEAARILKPINRHKLGTMNLLQRLTHGSAFTSHDCWLFTGTLNQHGYGTISAKVIGRGRSQLVHRVAWELFNGPIVGRQSVLHKCDVRNCFNPSHLFLGSHQDNMADMGSKNRHPNKKIQFATVERIRSDSDCGMSLGELVEKYGIAKSTACRIVNKTARQSF